MHQNGVNGSTDPCAAGHTWEEVSGGPVPRQCICCPAVGVPCNECEGGGCTRCRRTGTIEVVEISARAVTVMGRRFKWLLGEYAYLQGDRPRDVIREIDEMIAAGFAKGSWHGRPVPGLTGRPGFPRKKKPRSDSTRTGAAGHTPAQCSATNTLSDFHKKA